MRKKMPNFLTLDKDTSSWNNNVNGPLYVITVRWSIKSLSLSRCVLVQREYVCMISFYIFSLCDTLMNWQTKWPIGHLYFFNWIQIKRNEIFQLLPHFLFCVCPHKHTRAFMTYAYKCARARTQHAQMKMRNEIRKTSTTIKKRRVEEDTLKFTHKIACIVDMMYI